MYLHIKSSSGLKTDLVVYLGCVKESVKRRFLISNVSKGKIFLASSGLSRYAIRVLYFVFRVPTSRADENLPVPFSHIFKKLNQKSQLYDRDIL
jgi:hypothetical protein